jgi:4'-phosphopantetheinyl transferase
VRPACLLQHTSDLPPGREWLAPDETAKLASLRFPRRREDWLLGRWTAKTALARWAPQAGARLTEWEIGTASDGAPEVRHAGNICDVRLSLSHRSGICLCALADAGMPIGCDLEAVEPRGAAFEETWFTVEEIRWLDGAPAGARDLLATLIWSAKESALKLLRLGLRADTRRMGVLPCRPVATEAWQPLAVQDATDGRVFHGWWRGVDGMVYTLLADRAIRPPRAL